MLSLFENKLKELQILCEKYDVESLYVFGSACTEKFDVHSDLDFLVTFQKLSIERYTDNYFNLHNELEYLFGRKVDLITNNSLKNPFFIESLEESKQLLYAA